MAERLREVGKDERAEESRPQGQEAAPEERPEAPADAPPAGGEARPEEQPARPGGRARRALVAVLVILLIGSAFIAFVERRRASELAVRVDTLSQELASARAELQAYRAHLGEIRSVVVDVQRRVEELVSLASQQPELPAGVSPAPSPEELPAGRPPGVEAGEPGGATGEEPGAGEAGAGKPGPAEGSAAEPPGGSPQ